MSCITRYCNLNAHSVDTPIHHFYSTLRTTLIDVLFIVYINHNTPVTVFYVSASDEQTAYNTNFSIRAYYWSVIAFKSKIQGT